MTTFNDYFHDKAITKTITAADVFVRCIMKAVHAKNEDKLVVAQAFIDKAFTVPTNANKIANGGLQYWGFHEARYQARHLANMTNLIKWLSEEQHGLYVELVKAVKAPK